METYSHSKLSTFEQCPKKYKFQYVDHVKVDIKNTIEAFMGGIVHKVLEKFYLNKKNNLLLDKDELFSLFDSLWEEEFTEEIIFVKKTLNEEDYKQMGKKFIENYYDRFKEDKMKIIALETQDKLKLPDGNEWHIRIDKLGHDEHGTYFVCDYKTSSKMKLQTEADNDRQMGMYSIWVKEKFKDAKAIKLVWHMLAFNEDIFSDRQETQLKKHQYEVITLIKKIEHSLKESNFPAKIGPLCNYCIFQNICDDFKKSKKV